MSNRSGHFTNRRQLGLMCEFCLLIMKTHLAPMKFQVMGHLELHRSKMRFHDQQAKLAHKTKLASIGEMAASIAHEINNPLTIINGNVGLLRRITGQKFDANTPKTQQYLDSIEKTVHRIDKIIRGLKALSRDG